MSGVKRYDRTELLDRAVDLFHRQGSNGTSTAELVTELGVNRKSMYAEFGSKQQLFEAALDHYNAKHLSAVLAPVEAPDAGPDAIRQAFNGFASASEYWAKDGAACSATPPSNEQPSTPAADAMSTPTWNDSPPLSATPSTTANRPERSNPTPIPTTSQRSSPWPSWGCRLRPSRSPPRTDPRRMPSGHQHARCPPPQPEPASRPITLDAYSRHRSGSRSGY